MGVVTRRKLMARKRSGTNVLANTLVCSKGAGAAGAAGPCGGEVLLGVLGVLLLLNVVIDDSI
jgi:hypothetical protein